MALYFNSFSNYTSNSKPRHLACQVSFFICSSMNFYSTFFKHFVTNSISSLCLTNVVVNTSSWWIVAFFISSTTWMNVPSTLANFYCRAFRVSLVSFSFSSKFSNVCWISWNFWSNCLWANTSPALFFPTPAYGLQTPRDQCDVQCAFIHSIFFPTYAPTPTRVVEFFSHKTISRLSPSWPMYILTLLSTLPWNPQVLTSS